MAATTTNGALHENVTSPSGPAKNARQLPDLGGYCWSGDDGSSADEAQDRSQSGASGKRKRPLAVSCETCKQRKVKCDRGAPACSWCLKNNTACVYLPRKKPGLRAGYGRELEARLDKLEHALEQQQIKIDQLSNSTITTIPSQNETATFRSPPLTYTPDIPLPEADRDIHKPTTTSPVHNDTPSQLAATSSKSTHSIPGNGNGQRDGAAPGLRVINRSLDAPITDKQAISGVLSLSDIEFPPHDLLYDLVELFFNHIHPWCPILHRQATLNSLFSDTSLKEADCVIVHAIVATTLRFSTDQRLTPEKRAHYHKISKEKVLLFGIENSSVKSLQALVILALDVIGISNGPPGWNMLALITRSVVQLGLSVEKFSPSIAPQYASIYTLRATILPEPKDWIEDESRRRLFWMIYLLDRYATVATAFEFALSEDEVDRKLPCRDDMFALNLPVDTRWFRTTTRSDYSMDRPENLGPFSYHIEILGLLTRIHQFLKKPVDITSFSDVEKWQSQYRELDNAIEQWQRSLPQEFIDSAKIFTKHNRINRSLSSDMLMLHAAYHTTTIRLHSSAAYPTHRSPIFAPSFSASQRCLHAVEQITALCTYAEENGLLKKLGPPFAFSLWVAARVLLVHGSTIDNRVDRSINLLVRVLRDLGQYWAIGTRYANLLSRVLSEYEASQLTPADVHGQQFTPSTVKILADMRRCAFDLDFLISRQPRLDTTQPSLTPARTPAPNELQYLDVFEFFNMPRLPMLPDGTVHESEPYGGLQLPDGYGNESNITNYMVDASSDWFMK